MDSNKRPREEVQTPNDAPGRKIAKGIAMRATEPVSPTPGSSKVSLLPPLGTKPIRPMINRKLRKVDKPIVPKPPTANFPIMEDDLFSPSANEVTNSPEAAPSSTLEDWANDLVNEHDPNSSGYLHEQEALELQSLEETALERQRLLEILTGRDKSPKPDEATAHDVHKPDTPEPTEVTAPTPVVTPSSTHVITPGPSTLATPTAITAPATPTDPKTSPTAPLPLVADPAAPTATTAPAIPTDPKTTPTVPLPLVAAPAAPTATTAPTTTADPKTKPTAPSPPSVAPAPKAPAFSLEEEEEDSSSSLLASLAEQSVLANSQNAFGAFVVTTTPFDDIRIPLEAPGSTPKPAQANIQWSKILHQECTIGRQHESGNPLDFMPDHVIEECKKAATGKQHTLGDAKAILVNPGFKILVRVVHRNCPHDKMPAWIKHSIRSALDTAKLPLNGALSIIRMGKPTYDWHVVALTAAAYAHLSTIRALYDPRSRVLVLLRPWNMTPSTVQYLNYTGINTNDDIGEDEMQAARNLFRDQFTPVLAPHQVSIQEMSPITNQRAPDGPPMTQVTFNIASNTPFTLTPKSLPRAFAGPDGRPRTINPSWPRRCTTCLSESHKELLECPWRTHDFNGSVVSPYNPINLSPGQTEIIRKRRREDDSAQPESIMTDMRPTIRPAKKQKTTVAPISTAEVPPVLAPEIPDVIMA